MILYRNVSFSPALMRELKVITFGVRRLPFSSAMSPRASSQRCADSQTLIAELYMTLEPGNCRMTFEAPPEPFM